MAVPFGTKPKTEDVPVAQAGGAPAYRASLHQYRLNEGDHPQTGPTVSIFGQQMTGEASLMGLSANQTSAPTLVVEWVAEAGKRLWIVRITQEQPLDTADLKTVALLSSLSSLTLTSTTLGRSPTSVTPTSCIDTLAHPCWWNGTTCDTSHNPGSQQLGTSNYNGLLACGPLGGTVCVAFGGSSCVYEWQCVELVKRYLWIADGVPVYGANGNQMVNNYNGSVLSKIPSDTNPSDTSGQSS